MQKACACAYLCKHILHYDSVHNVCIVVVFLPRFAYVEFPDSETAEKVMKEKQGADLEGNTLFLDYTGSKSSFKSRDRSSGGNRSFSRDGGDRRKSQGLLSFAPAFTIT